MSFIHKIGAVLSRSPNVSGSAVAATRSVAKDRLSVILASQRGSELLAGVDMESLQQDVMEVVEKHISIAKNRPVQFQVNAEGQVSLFEMTVELATAANRSATNPQAA